jgi:predicted CXXCH cytochrome family protein
MAQARKRITGFSLLILGFCPLGVLAQRHPAAQAPPVAWRAPANQNPEAYAGAELCSACHPGQAAQFAKTVHANAAPAKAVAGTGCESCHGPGKAHVEAISAAGGDAGKMAAAKALIYGFRGKAADNAARCLECHNSSADQRLYARSEHKLMGISCEQCHASHLMTGNGNPGPATLAMLPQAKFFSVPTLPQETRWLQESLLRNKQPDLCFGCHKQIQAQFALPTHHRVPEGLMKCTDCHDAHGTLQRPLLKKANFETCVSCHTEKRGPFVHEHAAIKVEGCTACHSPHGSVERHNLLRREGRFLCLQCHVDPQAINVPHGRLGFTTRGECVRCHASIHGSNVSEYFLQ